MAWGGSQSAIPKALVQLGISLSVVCYVNINGTIFA
jgi:hypothetical protein